METTAMVLPSWLVWVVQPAGLGRNRPQRPAPPPVRIRRDGDEKPRSVAAAQVRALCGPIEGLVGSARRPPVLEELAAEIEAAAWELALEVVEEGLVDDQAPRCSGSGRLGQLGDMPTFIVRALARARSTRGRSECDPAVRSQRRPATTPASERRSACAARDRDRVPAPAARALARSSPAVRESSAQTRCSPSRQRLNATRRRAW